MFTLPLTFFRPKLLSVKYKPTTAPTSSQANRFKLTGRAALLTKNVYRLDGVSIQMADLLHKLEIITIYDLANNTLFNNTSFLATTILSEGDNKDIVLEITERVLKNKKILTWDELIKLPIDELNLSDDIISDLRNLGFNRIIELATWKPFHQARKLFSLYGSPISTADFRSYYRTYYSDIFKTNNPNDLYNPHLLQLDQINHEPIEHEVNYKIPDSNQSLSFLFHEESLDDFDPRSKSTEILSLNHLLNSIFLLQDEIDEFLTLGERLKDKIDPHTGKIPEEILNREADPLFKILNGTLTEISNNISQIPRSTTNDLSNNALINNASIRDILVDEVFQILIYDPKALSKLSVDDLSLKKLIAEWHKENNAQLMRENAAHALDTINAIKDHQEDKVDLFIQLCETLRDRTSSHRNAIAIKIKDLLKTTQFHIVKNYLVQLKITKSDINDFTPTPITLCLLLKAMNKDSSNYALWYESQGKIYLLATSDNSSLRDLNTQHMLYHPRQGIVRLKLQSLTSHDTVKKIPEPEVVLAPTDQFQVSIPSPFFQHGFLTPHNITTRSIELWINLFSSGQHGSLPPSQAVLPPDTSLMTVRTNEDSNGNVTGVVRTYSTLNYRIETVIDGYSYIVKIPFNNLVANHNYYFSIFIPFIGRFLLLDASASTLPTTLHINKEQGLMMIASSCYHFADDPQGRINQAFSNLIARNPKTRTFKVFLGDQVYIDIPTDFGKLRGSSAEIHQVLVTRCLNSWRGRPVMLSQGGGNYFIADDHEYYNDFPDLDSIKKYLFALAWYPSFRRTWMDTAIALYRGLQTTNSLIHIFNVSNDLSFCFANTRSGRSEHHQQFLPDSNFQQLLNWINNLKSPGVLSMPQPIFVEKEKTTYLGNATYQQLIDKIKHIQKEIRRILVALALVGIFTPFSTAALLIALAAAYVILEALKDQIAATPEFFASTPWSDHLIEYDQFKALAQALAKAQHDIVILCGDCHYGRLASVEFPNGHKIIEAMFSPLSNIRSHTGDDTTMIDGEIAQGSWQLNPRADQNGPHTSPREFPQPVIRTPDVTAGRIQYHGDIPTVPGSHFSGIDIFGVSGSFKTHKNFGTVRFWKPQGKPNQPPIAMEVSAYLPDVDPTSAAPRWKKTFGLG